VPGVVTTATSLVEARVPRTSVSGTADELLGRLFGRGAVAEQVLVDAGGTRRIPTGRLLVDPLTSQVVDAAGLVHPALYAFGSGTSAATPGAFSRPSTNAAFFRQNDASVRKVLADLAVDAQQPVNPAPRTHPRPDHPLFEVVDRDDPALHAYQDALRREANARFASRASTLPSSHSTVIAVRDHADVVVAAGAYEPLEGDRAELAGLWTTPSRRGQGLARALVRELERHAADHGYRRVQAHTGPRVPEAEALLRSEGYIPLTETSEDDGADAACRLRKVLDTAPSADALAPRTVTAAALLGRRRVS
jgi:GNAT superfamily N-acetyltransferase